MIDSEMTKRFQDIKASIELIEATALKGVDGKSLDELEECTFVLKNFMQQYQLIPTDVVLLRREIHQARMILQSKDV